MNKEKSDILSLSSVIVALLILFTNFQQLNEDAAWWLYMASFILANEILAFVLSDKEINKKMTITPKFHWLVAIGSISFVTLLLYVSHNVSHLFFEKSMPLNFLLVISWLFVVMGNALVYYSVIFPKRIPSYTDEWLRKNIKRDIHIGIKTVLYSAPMSLFIIVISVLIKMTNFYPSLWQSLLLFIFTSLGSYLTKKIQEIKPHEWNVSYSK